MVSITINGILLDIKQKDKQEITNAPINQKTLFDYLDLDSVGIFLNESERSGTPNRVSNRDCGKSLQNADITIHSIVGGG